LTSIHDAILQGTGLPQAMTYAPRSNTFPITVKTVETALPSSNPAWRGEEAFSQTALASWPRV